MKPTSFRAALLRINDMILDLKRNMVFHWKPSEPFILGNNTSLGDDPYVLFFDTHPTAIILQESLSKQWRAVIGIAYFCILILGKSGLEPTSQSNDCPLSNWVYLPRFTLVTLRAASVSARFLRDRAHWCYPRFISFCSITRVTVVVCPRLHGFPVSLARPAPHSGKGFEPSCCSTDIRLGFLDNMFNVYC